MQVIGINEADFQLRAIAERDGALVSGVCVLCVCVCVCVCVCL
jgi:hypothetical protein